MRLTKITGLPVVDTHVARLPKAMLGHLGARKLEDLRGLLEDVIGGLGAFP